MALAFLFTRVGPHNSWWELHVLNAFSQIIFYISPFSLRVEFLLKKNLKSKELMHGKVVGRDSERLRNHVTWWTQARVVAVVVVVGVVKVTGKSQKMAEGLRNSNEMHTQKVRCWSLD